MKTNTAVKVNNFVEAMGVRKIMEVAGYFAFTEKWNVNTNITHVELAHNGNILRVETSIVCDSTLISFDELCSDKRTITFDGKEIEISEESYQWFKKQLMTD